MDQILVTDDPHKALEKFKVIVAAKGNVSFATLFPQASQPKYAVRSRSGAYPVPGCIVGHWFSGEGVTTDQLIELDSATHAPSCEVQTLVDEGLVEFTNPQTKRMFIHLQNAQDGGMAWGDAIQDWEDTVEAAGQRV